MKKALSFIMILALMLFTAALAAPNTPGTATYTIYVVDQNGDPVPDCSIGMCVDTGCMPIEANEDGVAVYTGAPQKYHLKVIDAPDGYDYPDDTDIFVGPESGSQTLTITKE